MMKGLGTVQYSCAGHIQPHPALGAEHEQRQLICQAAERPGYWSSGVNTHSEFCTDPSRPLRCQIWHQPAAASQPTSEQDFHPTFSCCTHTICLPATVIWEHSVPAIPLTWGKNSIVTVYLFSIRNKCQNMTGV